MYLYESITVDNENTSPPHHRQRPPPAGQANCRKKAAFLIKIKILESATHAAGRRRRIAIADRFHAMTDANSVLFAAAARHAATALPGGKKATAGMH
ncbi:hypothetical protein ACFOLG_02970 [Vogesella facilis]|uniref:Uncharacterized protein n=1 Tax=Vogesella facilis TaxID=1655232 RepID=A0ABV7RC59_9NEIS